MSLTNSRRPNLKDKLAAQEAALRAEAIAVESEIKAVKGAKKRAGKN